MASYYNGYDEDEDSFSDGLSNEGSRYSGPDWCSCGQCVYLQDPKEQNCCHSHDCMVEYMNEYGVDCITDHPGFQHVVLNPHVLETAYYSYRKTKYRRGRLTKGERSNFKMFRHTAYRQLTRWCWGMLGFGKRKNLPACAITTIRSTFHPGYSNIPNCY